jgi:hypothetical protein
LIEGIVVDSLIHFTALKKGFALLHASCVSKNSQGILFIARSGGGKTTISTQLLDYGYTFISDNYTLLGPNGQLIGLKEPLNIFSYNLNERIKLRLTKLDKLILFLKNILYLLTNRYVKIFSRIKSEILFPDENDQTGLYSAFLLVPVNTENIGIDYSDIDKETLIRHLIYNQKLEFHYFDKYLLEYGFVLPDKYESNQWTFYEKNIRSNLAGRLYKIQVPKKYNNTSINEIVEVISSVTNNKL